jgi:hypothetical protein
MVEKTRTSRDSGLTEDTVRQSKLIFKGKVEKVPSSSNISQIVAGGNTGLVKVNEVIEVPPLFEDIERKTITVQMDRESKIKDEAIFLTKGQAYGESIMVQEITRLSPEQNIASLRKEIREISQKLEDEELKNRISDAKFLVIGKVVSTRPFEPYEQNRQKKGYKIGVVDPDAPNWEEAIIDIESVLKGNVSSNRINVIFPKSFAVFWYDKRRYNIGDEGIWILHSAPEEEVEEENVEGYVALNRLDFLPKDQIKRIRKLLENSRPG